MALADLGLVESAGEPLLLGDLLFLFQREDGGRELNDGHCPASKAFRMRESPTCSPLNRIHSAVTGTPSSLARRSTASTQPPPAGNASGWLRVTVARSSPLTHCPPLSCSNPSFWRRLFASAVIAHRVGELVVEGRNAHVDPLPGVEAAVVRQGEVHQSALAVADLHSVAVERALGRTDHDAGVDREGRAERPAHLAEVLRADRPSPDAVRAERRLHWPSVGSHSIFQNV